MGAREAVRFTRGGDGHVRVHLRIGDDELELLLLLGDAAPGRGAPPRSGIFPSPVLRPRPALAVAPG